MLGKIAGCLGPPDLYIKGLTSARRIHVKHRILTDTLRSYTTLSYENSSYKRISRSGEAHRVSCLAYQGAP